MLSNTGHEEEEKLKLFVKLFLFPENKNPHDDHW